MNSIQKIRLALQRENSRYKQPPPTFSDDELAGIRSIFAEICKEYPGQGYEVAKQRILAALLETSIIYEHLVCSYLIDSMYDRDIFSRICKDLINEGLPVKTYEATVYGSGRDVRRDRVLERM